MRLRRRHSFFVFVFVLGVVVGSVMRRGDYLPGQVLAAPVVEQSFIGEFGGLSYWWVAPGPVDLSEAGLLLDTVLSVGDGYLFGSFQVGGQPVYFYAEGGGLMMALLPRWSPGAMAFDLGAAPVGSRLQAALGQVALELGFPVPVGVYWDFRFPGASQLLFVYDDVTGGVDDFRVVLPGSLAVYEVSWAGRGDTCLLCVPVGAAVLRVDAVEVWRGGPGVSEGFGAVLLEQDVEHVWQVQGVSGRCVGGVVVISGPGEAVVDGGRVLRYGLVGDGELGDNLQPVVLAVGGFGVAQGMREAAGVLMPRLRLFVPMAKK